ncbi:MAG: right-handed parallel beta-helix repeat-containing protein [Chloroflexi bacterium]|nr:right-handed parallel beta-helix repeat-containing protein [Chloroflexota bacterium]
MRKTLAILLVLVGIVALVIGCSVQQGQIQTTTETSTVTIAAVATQTTTVTATEPALTVTTAGPIQTVTVTSLAKQTQTVTATVTATSTATVTVSGPTSTTTAVTQLTPTPIPSPTYTPLIGGTLASNKTLTANGSPYLLTGSLLIPAGMTFTIEPGVTVDLDDKFIRVEGMFQARGTRERQIQITSSRANSKDPGIFFANTSTPWDRNRQTGSVMEYVSMRVDRGLAIHINVTNDPNVGGPRIANSSISNPSGSGIFVSGTSIVEYNVVQAKGTVVEGDSDLCRIEGNVIKGGTIGLRLSHYGVQVKGNLISGNETGIELVPGYTVGKVQGLLTENTVVANSAYGLLIDGLDLNGPEFQFPAISANSIYGNGKYDVYVQKTTKSIDLANNWWGTTETASIEKHLYDKRQDFRVGQIIYQPFLTSAPSQAPSP